MRKFQFCLTSITFVIFLLVSSTVFSKDKAAQEFTALMSEFQTLSGNYSQVLSDKNSNILQTTKGTFQLKKPGLFFWHTSPPYEQKVIGNKSTLWVYDPDLEQVTVAPQQDNANSPAKLLSGDLAYINKHYEVKKVQATKNMASFSLRALESGSDDFVAIVFNFKDKLIQSLAIEDKLGQTTRLSFSELKPNRKIEDSVFSFTPPEGTDIINQK